MIYIFLYALVTYIQKIYHFVSLKHTQTNWIWMHLNICMQMLSADCHIACMQYPIFIKWYIILYAEERLYLQVQMVTSVIEDMCTFCSMYSPCIPIPFCCCGSIYLTKERKWEEAQQILTVYLKMHRGIYKLSIYYTTWTYTTYGAVRSLLVFNFISFITVIITIITFSVTIIIIINDCYWSKHW